jgi:hypothetical protein
LLKRRPELLSVPRVATSGCPVDIIGNHGADPATTIGLAKQTLRQRGRDNLWDMLMLGKRQHLRLGQPA